MKKQERGITLIALTITVIVLIILASVATYSGLSSIKSSKFTKFKMELEILQSQVDLLYEEHKDEIQLLVEGEYFTSIGKSLPEGADYTKQLFAAKEDDSTGYTYFDADVFEELEIEGIERNYLVNIAKRKVIAVQGFTYQGMTYYTLEQINESPKVGGLVRGNVTVENLSYKKIDTGYEITLENIRCSEYVGKYTVKYKKSDDTHYILVDDSATGKNFTFNVDDSGLYYIQVIDAAGRTTATEIIASVYDESETVSKVDITTYTGITLVVGNSGTPELEWTGEGVSKTFSSSDETIATIDANTGEVKGVKAGTAIMTVAFTNHDGTTTSKTCTVTVNNGNVMIASTGVHYTDLANAISAATSGDTLQVVQDYTDSSTATISKDLTINTNGKTLTKTTASITINSGYTVTLAGSGTLTTSTISLINNNGTLDINHTGTISYTGSNSIYVINNYGTLTAQGSGKIDTSIGSCIYNEATLNIKDGTFIAQKAGHIILNYKTFNMTGGTIIYKGNDDGAAIVNKGTMNMTTGTIQTTAFGLVTRGTDAKTTVTGGTITGTSTSGHVTVMADKGGIALIYNTTLKAADNKPVVAIAEFEDVAGKQIYLFDCNISGNIIDQTTEGAIVEVVKTSTGYNIYYYDSDSSATKVDMPTWVDGESSDSIKWYSGIKGSRYNCVVWYYSVNKSNHSNKTGTYYTHMYEDDTYRAGIGYTVN